MKIRYVYNNEKPCNLCGKEEKNRGCRIVMNKNKELLTICNVCYSILKDAMERHERVTIKRG